MPIEVQGQGERMLSEVVQGQGEQMPNKIVQEERG